MELEYFLQLHASVVRIHKPLARTSRVADRRCLAPSAAEAGTTPHDTRAWSQILVSVLTGINGREREKGSDLRDGSDVKAANCWSAIDTPRFNGAIPAGRSSDKSRKAEDLSALDDTPFIFFVLWDNDPIQQPRCRIWCVRATQDPVFRGMCQKWYDQRLTGEIRSPNFQLHPPRFQDHNVIRNTCGNLEYPLLFHAVMKGTATDGKYELVKYDPLVLTEGVCRAV